MTPHRPQPLDSSTPGGARARRPWRRFFRGLLWIFLVAGLTLIALQLVGIPGTWAGGVLRAFEERGVYLDAGRISLDVRRGIVVRGCRVYEEPVRRIPLMEADSLGFRLGWWSLFRGRLRVREVTVENGLLRLESNRPDQADLSLTLEEIDARVAMDESSLSVAAFSALAMGVHITGQGRIDLPPAPSAGEAARPEVSLQHVRLALQDLPPRLSVLIDQIGQAEFAAPPDVEVAFILRPGVASGSIVRFRGGGGRTTVRGLAFDEWAFDGSLRGTRLEGRRAFARTGDERIVASGSYQLESRVTEAHIDSSLSPVYLEGLIPIGWRDRMDETGLFFGGPLRLEVSLGPDVPERLLDSFAGRIRILRAELRQVWVERADVPFRLEGQRLQVPAFDLVIGKGAMQGPAHGAFVYDLATRSVEGHLHSEFDWAEMLPVISGGAARAIRFMQFEQRPPVADVRFAGRPGAPEGLFLEGTLSGEDFLYRGTHVNRFRSGLLLTNRVLTLSPLHAERDEGCAEGRVAIDFKAKRVDLDLHSTADPPAAARTGGETVARIVNRFRFEGPTEAEMKGSAYYGTNGVTEIHARGRGSRIGLQWFMADEASFDFHLVGREALVTNLVYTAYGGEGDGVVRVFQDGDRWRFDADLDARDMDLGDVVKWSMHREDAAYPGSISIRGNFEGQLGEDFMSSLAGTGTVQVGEAPLLQIPLFFGLSHGLSLIYPGLGFATQNDFHATFDVRDRRVYTHDAKLEGTMLGLTADGWYGLEKRDLHFTVEVRLLRDHGVASSLVQLVTSPLSKLLQFDLRGTLEAPRWRPNNLPKELFLMFD